MKDATTTKRSHCDNCGQTLGLDCGDAEPDFNDRFCSVGCHEMGQRRWAKTKHTDWFSVEVREGMAVARHTFRTMAQALSAAEAMAQGHNVHTRVWTGWSDWTFPDNVAWTSCTEDGRHSPLCTRCTG